MRRVTYAARYDLQESLPVASPTRAAITYRPTTTKMAIGTILGRPAGRGVASIPHVQFSPELPVRLF